MGPSDSMGSILAQSTAAPEAAPAVQRKHYEGEAKLVEAAMTGEGELEVAIAHKKQFDQKASLDYGANGLTTFEGATEDAKSSIKLCLKAASHKV